MDAGTETAEHRRAEPPENRRRPVVVQAFVTMDGYMVGPDEDISWVSDGFDSEMQDDIAVDMSERSDLFVFGRVTFEIFAEYWPIAVPYDEDDDLAPSEGKEDPRIIRALNDFPKVVFSTTLEPPAWDNTRVVAGGLEDEIRRLKDESGKAINVQGSSSIVQALSRADLIDEYRLYVHPVLLGDGKPLFAGGHRRQDFELTQLKTYPNGVVAMSYSRKAAQH
jgi:dihydrofolate reductase